MLCKAATCYVRQPLLPMNVCSLTHTNAQTNSYPLGEHFLELLAFDRLTDVIVHPLQRRERGGRERERERREREGG